MYLFIHSFSNLPSLIESTTTIYYYNNKSTQCTICIKAKTQDYSKKNNRYILRLAKE